MTGEFDTDVLIVGLGPVGATLAALLSDAGVRTIAVDRETQVYPLPRAAHFDHEIMRLFQQLGVADEVLRHARPAPPYEFRAGDGRLLMKFDATSEVSASGWTNSYMFYQPGLEHALRAKLAASRNADVRLGVCYESCRQDAAGVTADLVGPDGAPVRLRARYLVGCDGARSLVRREVGEEMHDYGFDEPWLVVDAAVSPIARVPDVNLQICDPGRPTTCVLMGPGRHRWEFMLLPGESPEAALADGFVHALLREWDCLGEVTIERRAVYRFHGLVSKQWREGRVLLAGDAAHQMPPFAGQGMCSGLRDAANLAWKLAAVLRERADARLLDTYQAEREPHVRAYVELAIGMGRVVCTLDPDVAAQRDAMMLARLESGEPPLPTPGPGRLQAGVVLAGAPGAGELFPQPWDVAGPRPVGFDDAMGAGAWLIVRRGRVATRPGVVAISLDDAPAQAFAGPLAAWLDARGAQAVLVRPDRYVFGTGEADDLLAAYAAAITTTLEPA